MNDEQKTALAAISILVVYYGSVLLFWGLIIYTAVHFVTKYW